MPALLLLLLLLLPCCCLAAWRLRRCSRTEGLKRCVISFCASWISSMLMSAMRWTLALWSTNSWESVEDAFEVALAACILSLKLGLATVAAVWVVLGVVGLARSPAASILAWLPSAVGRACLASANCCPCRYIHANMHTHKCVLVSAAGFRQQYGLQPQLARMGPALRPLIQSAWCFRHACLHGFACIHAGTSACSPMRCKQIGWLMHLTLLCLRCWATGKGRGGATACGSIGS